MKKNRYTVTINARNPESHRVQITIRSKNSLPSTLRFPVWTPGSYFVRDYSRHITRVSNAKKISKNAWQLTPQTNEISYEVYCFERTVRTSFIDENYATLMGATLLPILDDGFEVTLKLPAHWQFVSSALRFKKKSTGVWTANVKNSDDWFDSPIVAATKNYGERGTFLSQGKRHEIAWVGSDCARSMKDLIRDFKNIANTTQKMFAGAPFQNYVFLLHFGAKLYGGLEHRNSQLSQFDGNTLHDENSYKDFLRLIAHEYFHAWNVKSIRPEALGPFDYEKENYTEDLWFAEGITDYFDDYIPYKAGLFDKKKYWEERLDDIKMMNDGLPSHFRRSLSESSFDAWIRHYRPDEDSSNSDVSYYTKGSILGMCWDAYLQKKSHNKWNLEKVMRAIWNEFGVHASEKLYTAKPGFTRTELLQFVEKTTKIQQARLVESWVSSRRPLPWHEALQHFKIKLRTKVTDQALHNFGMQINWDHSQATIAKVISASTAEAAGLSPNDELIAIENERINDKEHFQKQLKKFLPKKKLKLTIARLNKVVTKMILVKPSKSLGLEFVHHSNV